MTEHWRGDPALQTAISKWLRSRWRYGSLKVLDVDAVITSNDYTRGMLIEAKHVASKDKYWTCTRTMAGGLGFYGTLLVYDTDDGTDHGTIIDDSLRATVYSPGRPSRPAKNGEPVDVAKFDQWVQEQFGD
jgi:hypothetical protein